MILRKKKNPDSGFQQKWEDNPGWYTISFHTELPHLVEMSVQAALSLSHLPVICLDV